MTIKQQFIQFLKQNNAYEQFMFNFKHKRTFKINFINFINNTETFNLIYHAFPWHITKEGISTWNKLSKQWLILLNVPQIFTQFLKDNNAYQQYMNQIKYTNHIPFIGIKVNSFEDIFNYYQPENYINILIKSLNLNPNTKTINFITWKELNIKWISLINTYKF